MNLNTKSVHRAGQSPRASGQWAKRNREFMQAESIPLFILEGTQKPWASFPFLYVISWMEACALQQTSMESPRCPTFMCVKLGKSWNCCTQAGSSACACVKATGVKFAFRASGAACKDLDKGPESLHPTWRKSPSVSGKHGQSCSCYCLGKNFCDPTVTDCAWREVVVSTKIKCSVLLLDCSWCAAASGTEADDTDGLDQTIELDSLVRMQTTVAPTSFWDFFSPYTEWILWCKTKSM